MGWEGSPNVLDKFVIAEFSGEASLKAATLR
jgi:hypothetical protein